LTRYTVGLNDRSKREILERETGFEPLSANVGETPSHPLISVGRWKVNTDDREEEDGVGRASAPALGVEERSDEALSAGAGTPSGLPDPEVVAKPKRRRFTAEYRLRILEEAGRCAGAGEVGHRVAAEVAEAGG
jgi:hypothetical protein